MTSDPRPLIGITLDHEEPAPGENPVRYSKYPWYALRQNYADCITAVGGLPVGLPHEPELAEAYLDRLDGLLVTGGAFDVDPALFGAAATHETVTLKQRRTAAELALVQGALARDLPVLGICGGQQLLAVALGGTLIQHIPDSIADPLAHEQPNPRHEAGHAVIVSEGSLLHRITGETEFMVNSAHHQAAASVGPGTEIDAVAADGVIEGIENRAYRFCLGVQWHPEFFITPADEAILAAFVDACR